jgi:hypothetical protein
MHLAFTPDNRYLVSSAAGQDHTACLWDTSSGALVRTFEPVYGAAALAPDGRLFAAYSYQCEVKLWDVSTGKVVRALAGHQRGLTATAFSPDGRLLASASLDETARLWRVVDGSKLHCFEYANTWPAAVAFTRDGCWLLIGCYDGTVQVREVTTGAVVQSFKHFGNPEHIVAAPDGRSVWVCDENATVSVYDLATGKCLATFGDRAGDVTALALAADGQTLGTGRMDGAVFLWKRGDVAQLPPLAAVTPTPQEMAALWADLASPDGECAYKAYWTLRASRAQGVAWLRQRLAAVPTPDAQQLARHLADLDSDQYKVREQAMFALEQAGDAVELQLRKVLQSKPTLEVRRRVEKLLEKIATRPPPAETLRALRAIAVLEALGGPAAREVLAELAASAPGAQVTVAAQGALRRWP